VAIDADLALGLHLATLDRAGAVAEAPEHDGEAFQSSTIAALFDGAYEGDLPISELLRHGDLGLGTVDALDGELVVIDGEAWRADIHGRLHRVDPATRTPFAVVTAFRPTIEAGLPAALDHAALLVWLEDLADGEETYAIRIDGELGRVHARSVPRQSPPYRPLAEVAADQHEFDLGHVGGSLVGFRFPSRAEGVEVAGFHLHVVDDDRTRGGHVLDAVMAEGGARIAPLHDLHVELPPGVTLPAAPSDADREAVRRVEGG
jgi:acetolactate decarboxylase